MEINYLRNIIRITRCIKTYNIYYECFHYSLLSGSNGMENFFFITFFANLAHLRLGIPRIRDKQYLKYKLLTFELSKG